MQSTARAPQQSAGRVLGMGIFSFPLNSPLLYCNKTPATSGRGRKKAPHRGCGAGKVHLSASLRLAISACSAGRFFSTVQNSTSTAQTR